MRHEMSHTCMLPNLPVPLLAISPANLALPCLSSSLPCSTNDRLKSSFLIDQLPISSDVAISASVSGKISKPYPKNSETN